MKADIHPTYVETRSPATAATVHHAQHRQDGSIHVEVCSACHPFYTGKQKILDTGGRIAKFEKRFGKKADGPPRPP